MSVKIDRLNLKSPWNCEYTIFINQLIAIITKYQPSALHLEKAFNKLAAFVPKIAKIKALELSSAISLFLSNLYKECDMQFNDIVAQIKNMERVNLPSVTPHVAIIKHFISVHGEDIADAPYNSETKRLNDLMAYYKTQLKTRY